MKDQCTKKRINKLFKYFKNKKVHVEVERNNSMGHHWLDEYDFMYNRFDISTYRDEDWNTVLRYKEESLFEQEFGVYDYFTGLGKVTIENGDGTYNYFKITEEMKPYLP